MAIAITSSGIDFNGTTQTTKGSAGFRNMQVFTSSGTFTVPAGVTKVKVTVTGGGGNGNAGSGSYGSWHYSGNGGGAGATAIKVVTGLTPGGTVAVTVGGAGGTSSFGAYCSATGGGDRNSGTATGGDININGGCGNAGDGWIQTVSTHRGGVGGQSYWGSGGGGSGYWGQGARSAAAYGGGGGGGCGSSGASGYQGVVVVEY